MKTTGLTNADARYLIERTFAFSAPFRLEASSSWEEDKELVQEMCRWCEERFGPNAVTYPAYDDFVPGQGPIAFDPDMTWAYRDSYRCLFYFKDERHAFEFKLAWG